MGQSGERPGTKAPAPLREHDRLDGEKPTCYALPEAKGKRSASSRRRHRQKGGVMHAHAFDDMDMEGKVGFAATSGRNHGPKATVPLRLTSQPPPCNTNGRLFTAKANSPAPPERATPICQSTHGMIPLDSYYEPTSITPWFFFDSERTMRFEAGDETGKEGGSRWEIIKRCEVFRGVLGM